MAGEVQRALARSHLGALPGDVVEPLLAGSLPVRVPAGAVMHREGEPARHVELVVSGLIRVFVAAPDGRTMTVRYCRSGALIGVVSLFAGSFSMPANTQALTDASVLKLPPEPMTRAAQRDPRVAGALLRELSERVLSFVGELPGSAFTTVRQRVARHLLDLASEAPDREPAGALLVTVTQRELAEAVGSVREVVVRVLRELREEGVVRTERDRIVILDPARLIAEQSWNTGS